MAEIDKYKADLLSARYGEEIREAIYNCVNILGGQAASTAASLSGLTSAGELVYKANLVDGTTPISATNIKSGTLDGSTVTVKNLSASNITRGKMDASRVDLGIMKINAENVTFKGDDSDKTVVDEFSVKTGEVVTSYVTGVSGDGLYISGPQDRNAISIGDGDALTLWSHRVIRMLVGEDAVIGDDDSENEHMAMRVHASDENDFDVYIYADVHVPNVYNNLRSSLQPNVCVRDEEHSYRLVRSTDSSRRFKHDIVEELSEELDPHRLLELPVVQFKYNDDYLDPSDPNYGRDVVGLIAEDVERHYPVACEHSGGQPQNWNARYLLPPMLSLIQELYRRVEELEGKVAVLESA